jgi:hypothetical protein
MEGKTEFDIKNTYAIPEVREKRRRLMIVGASCGLILCLTALAIFKKEMSEEVIGILYMITGIFGACLTEAYNFEFKLFRPRFRKNERK